MKRIVQYLAVAIAATAIAAVIGAHHSAAHASANTALQLADRALMSPALLEDEGQYRLIDPVGPGGATSIVAADEVFASIMIGGKYGPYRQYRNPFTQPNVGPLVYPGAPYPWPITLPYYLELRP